MRGYLEDASGRVALNTLGEHGHASTWLIPQADRTSFESLIVAWKRNETIILQHPRWGDATIQAAQELIRIHGTDRDDAFIAFTSGSTRGPKGVRLGRNAITTAASAVCGALSLVESDRWYSPLPPAHVGGLMTLHRCAHVGATVVLPTAKKFSVDGMLRDLHNKKITVMSCVPTMLSRMLSRGFQPPSTLRACIVGGDALPSDVHQRALGRGIPVLRSYGMTETAAMVAIEREPSRAEDASGTLVDGVEARIQEGELSLRGDQLFDGYVGHPSRQRSDWFSTKDVASIDGSQLKLHGRKDNVVIVGGENIQVETLEFAISSALNIEVAISAIPHDDLGNVLVALTPSATALVELQRAALTFATFVHVSAVVQRDIPRRPNGKIDRNRLKVLINTSLD